MEKEKICANDLTGKGLMPKIHKQLIQLNIKMKKKTQKLPNQKMDKRPKQTSLQRRHIDGQQAHQKMLNIANREMHTKTTMMLSCHTVRMAIIKNSTNKECWRGCGKNRIFLHSWLECKLVQPLWKTAYGFLKKLKIELPYDPAIQLLGIYLEKTFI